MPLGRYTPLDAAGPMFDECSEGARVARSDAVYVDFIHTDSGKLPALSMAAAVGDADFYVNDGRHQPGCPDDLLDTNCQHQRAVELWTSSFDDQCYVCPCESYDDLLNGLCNIGNCRRPNVVGYYSQQVQEPTTYYFTTTATAPYCMTQSNDTT